MILTHVVSVNKLADKTGNANQEDFDTPRVLTLNVNIQPASPEDTVISEGAFGKTFKMFAPTTASGVIEGDKITVVSGTNSGDTYIVKGRENWNLGGPLPHMEFTLFEDNE